MRGYALKTTVMGAAIAFASTAALADAPARSTFTKGLAPILQRDCQLCPRPLGANVSGMIAPMSLMTGEVKISFGSLRAGTPLHKTLANVEDGEVFEFGTARATKIFTDADLKFGDVLIETENAGPNYPGVYSLWLKKVGDGWNLVFNEEADIWGSMHNPEADVAEIPLTLSKCDTEQKLFDINLDERGKEGVLRVAWGSQQWSADFVLAQ